MSPYRISAKPAEPTGFLVWFQRKRRRFRRRFQVWCAEADKPMLDHRPLWRRIHQKKRGYHPRVRVDAD